MARRKPIPLTEELEAERFMPMEEVARFLGCSRRTIARLEATDPTFPKRVRLRDIRRARVSFVAAEIRGYRAARLAQLRADVPPVDAAA